MLAIFRRPGWHGGGACVAGFLPWGHHSIPRELCVDGIEDALRGTKGSEQRERIVNGRTARRRRKEAALDPVQLRIFGHSIVGHGAHQARGVERSFAGTREVNAISGGSVEQERLVGVRFAALDAP